MIKSEISGDVKKEYSFPCLMQYKGMIFLITEKKSNGYYIGTCLKDVGGFYTYGKWAEYWTELEPFHGTISLTNE